MKYLVVMIPIVWALFCCTIYPVFTARLPAMSTTGAGQLEAAYKDATTDAQRQTILDQLNKAGFTHIAEQLQHESATKQLATIATAPLSNTLKIEESSTAPEPAKVITKEPEEPQKAGAPVVPFSQLEQLELEIDNVLRRASHVWNDDGATRNDIDAVTQQIDNMSAKLDSKSKEIKDIFNGKIVALRQKSNMFATKKGLISLQEVSKQIDHIKSDIKTAKSFQDVRLIMDAIDQLSEKIRLSNLQQSQKDSLYERIKKELEELLYQNTDSNPLLRRPPGDILALRKEVDAIGKRTISLLLQENPLLQDIDDAIQDSDQVLEKLQKISGKSFFKEEIKLLLQRKELLKKKGAQQVHKLKK